jgi:hypothetical protein
VHAVTHRYLPPGIPASQVAYSVGLVSDTHMPERYPAFPPSLATDSWKVVVWTGEQHVSKGQWPNLPWHHPFMAALLARLLGEDPFCIAQVCVDAIVLHHRGQSPRRPNWLNHGRLTRDIATDGVELLQALPAAEGLAVVPVDQWLVHGSTQQVWLPAGQYVLRGLHGADHTAWKRSLVIEQT